MNRKFYYHKFCINCKSKESSFINYRKFRSSIDSINTYDFSVVCCENCGLLFNNPLPSDDILAKFYSNADANRSLNNKKDVIKTIKRANLKKKLLSLPYIEKYIGIIKNSVVLDIGCDNGGWLDEFDKSNRLIGIETSKENVIRAKRFFGVEVVERFWDFGLLPDNSVDFITSMHTFEHFKDPVSALLAANHVLRPKGYIHLQVPSPEGLVFRRGLDFAFKPYHFYYFSEDVLNSLLLQTGFKIINSRNLKGLRFGKKSIFDSEYYASGMTEVIAQKVDKVLNKRNDLNVLNKENSRKILSSLELSEKLDKKFIFIYRLRKLPFIGILFKVFHKIGIKLFSTHTSIENFQKKAIHQWIKELN